MFAKNFSSIFVLTLLSWLLLLLVTVAACRSRVVGEGGNAFTVIIIMRMCNCH